MGYLFLSSFYALGEGVVRDYDQSFFWFNKSAELGYLNGMYNLGLSYVNGWGTQKDIKKGEELLKVAKEKGFHDAIQYFKNKERQRALEAAELKRQRGNEIIDCPYPWCVNGYSGTMSYGGKYTLPTVCPQCNGRGWVRRHEIE
ncbi:MAG: sel1 repeat family protein [Bacteroidaceae bacterium]|nr:sel1 repeat family protein [Bacteroidaceae bacterium]